MGAGAGAVERASKVIRCLHLLDGGCTRLLGRVLGALVAAQRAQPGAAGGGGGRELARAGMQAARLGSSYSILSG